MLLASCVLFRIRHPSEAIRRTRTESPIKARSSKSLIRVVSPNMIPSVQPQ